MKRLISLAAGLLITGTVAAQEAITSESVEAFIDKAWKESLNTNGVVPGAVVTVVHDGQIILNKGYGTSDMETGEPTDPNNTRVRIGSTSKLFTSLTALALVDEGKLELDRDVNDYLTDVKVPDTFDAPVTPRTLLSHLSGFDADTDGYMSFDNNSLGMSPEEYQRRLRRFRPVGQEYGYDNMGLGLIGHVSGIVNGSSFSEAVEQKVLQPLGMTKTTMGVPDRQLKHLAACHSWDGNAQLTKCTPKFMKEVFQGAGDITTTGSDMARFMIANLDNSCLDGSCVLKQATYDQYVDMDQNRFHPLAKGLGLIMFEYGIGDTYSIGHSGGQDGFSTTMVLFPDNKTGIFISQFTFMGIPSRHNLSMIMDMIGRGSLVNPYSEANKVIAEFAETYIPESSKSEQPVASEFTKDDLSKLAGVYADTRGVGIQLLARVSRTLSTLPVSVSGDEVMIGGKGPYNQTGDRLLTMEGDSLKWFYKINGDHAVLQNSNGLAIAMFSKQPWHQQAKFVVFPLLLAILLAVPALIFGLVKRQSPASRNVGFLVFFSGLAVLVGFYLDMEYFTANYYPEGATLAMISWRLLINLGWVAALVALYTLIKNRPELIGFGGAAASLRSLLVVLFAVAAIAVAVLLPYWGLVGNFTA